MSKVIIFGIKDTAELANYYFGDLNQYRMHKSKLKGSRSLKKVKLNAKKNLKSFLKNREKRLI